MKLEALNRLPAAEAAQAFERCCGSKAWVKGMNAARPFKDRKALFAAAERVAKSLGRADWLEAFSHHPKIGDRESLGARLGAAAAWAADEQRGADAASVVTLHGLAQGNRSYEERFGYIFIVCASGRSADELFVELQKRLKNDPEKELENAAREQRAITRLRLEKLLKEE